MCDLAQLMMRKTEIVAASNQIHPGLQCEQTTSCMTRSARQTGQSFPEGPIQALNKSGIEDAPAMREQEQPLRLSHQTMGHLAGDLDHPPFLRSLDHRADMHVCPDLQTRSPHSRGLLDLLSEGSTNTVGVRTPPVCQEKQRAQSLGRPAHLLHQAVGQAAISRKLDHPTHPQARRHHHGQAHPCDHLTAFHPNFIGLNVHQIQLSLLYDVLMHLVTRHSCSITPISNGPLIQAKGMDNGLDRASIRQEGDNNNHQVHGLAQPLKHRSPTRTERLFAHRTPIALSRAIMDRDRAHSALASCRTRLVRAKYVRRVHWLCVCFHRLQHADGRLFFQVLLTFSPVSVALPTSASDGAPRKGQTLLI